MTYMRTIAALFCAAALTAAASLPAPAGPNCTCRYKGVKYEVGQVLCIMGKLRRCEMALNNTSWKIHADLCPFASLDLPRSQPQTASAPVRR